MRRTVLALASALVAPALGAWACSFPEITIAGDTKGTGGTSSSSMTGGAAGSAGSTASSASGTSSASSGSGGATTSSSSSTSSSTSASSGACTTDDDGDGFISWTCNKDDPTKDCADEDDLAHPDAGFQAAPIQGVKKLGTLPFDFNCNGSEEAETGVLACPGLSAVGCPAGKGFQGTVMCGQSAPLGHCVPAGLNCAWAPMNPAENAIQRCK